MKPRPRKPEFTDVTDQTSQDGPVPVNVRTLLNKIDFSPDNVVEAASVNPGLYVRAIEYRLQCLTEKSRQDMNHKRLRAETELEIRRHAKANDEKITEDHIKAKLLLNKDVSAAGEQAQQAETMDEYSKLVVEAFRMRRDSLRIVADMSRQEMNLGRALEANADLQETREKLRSKFPS
jgi:hypothetical protein